MNSKRFRWNSADTKKFLDEAWKKSVPYLVVVIPVMLTQIPDEWAYGSILVFILQRIYSAAKLYVAGKK